MKFPTRKFLLNVVIASLSTTAVLGIIAVLWTGLGETGAKILGSAIGVDVASLLTLCCTGPTKSLWHRTVQVTGILSASLGLVSGLYVIWRPGTAGALEEGMTRTAVVLLLLAVASAHAFRVLAWRTYNRPMRLVAPATILCIAAAAELIANYLVFPGFDPGRGYLRALVAMLILDALGTILLLLLHRFGPPRSGSKRSEHWRLVGDPQGPGDPARSAGGDVFQAAPGGFGQYEGEREAEYRYPGGEQERAAQAQ
jgi:hypothetical protein